MAQPKLVVQVVVDQMRAEFLQRFNHQFAEDGGFRILLDSTTTSPPTRGQGMRASPRERPRNTMASLPTTGWTAEPMKKFIVHRI
jgi:hypothetical protein